MDDHNHDHEWGPTGLLMYLLFPFWALWVVLKATGVALLDIGGRIAGLFHTVGDE